MATYRHITDFFRLRENGTTVSREVICGFTTFLTMSYVLFVNPAIVSQSGMPSGGIFAATALASAVCSIIMAFFANTPLAMAPGMGLNTMLAFTMCVGLGFHWKEAMAVAFITGILHIIIMASPLRKALVNAIPHHLKIATSVALGLFIAYIGLKNAGFLSFISSAGHYVMTADGTVISDSAIIPGVIDTFAAPQMLALIGLVIMLILLALEKKTGDGYAALAVGILAAAFIGIPLQVTDLAGMRFIDFSSLGEIGQVCLSFFGTPGIASLLDSPDKALLSLLMIMVLLVTNIMDSIGTVIGIGQVRGAEIFDRRDMEKFERQGRSSKLDKTLICNSLGGSIAALFGTTTTTTYLESITGIVSGGRTGLTALVVGFLFLLCLPLSNFFSIVPAAAIAPALIVAGSYMMTLAIRIDWTNFEESFPAFMTILVMPLTYGIIYGVAAGVLSHVALQIALGKWRRVHPMLYIISLVFILTAVVGIVN